MADDSLVKGRITEESLALMRRRIGFPNPTLRVGVLSEPWNIRATGDAMRRFSLCIGDDNPLYCDPDYAASTRWGEVIAPPGFEKSMGLDRSREMDADFAKETSKALRGVQLFYSGGENFYYRPITEGVTLYRSKWVADVQEKTSKFAQKSAVVTNSLALWDDQDNVYVDGVDWYVHAERRKVADGDTSGKYAKDEPAVYTDEDIEEIEAAYDAEYRRGSDVLYLEDVKIGQVLPRMVKGPFTVTDLINLHMGAGWLVYGNPPYRLAYEALQLYGRRDLDFRRDHRRPDRSRSRSPDRGRDEGRQSAGSGERRRQRDHSRVFAGRWRSDPASCPAAAATPAMTTSYRRAVRPDRAGL
jgi:acyl dehydratase